MRTRHARLIAFAGIAIATGVILGLAGWPQPHRALEFSGLILAAILTSFLTMSQPAAEDEAVMPLSFVVDCTALLLFGPHAAMLVATVGTVMQGLGDSERPHPHRRLFVNTETVMVAIQEAGQAHRVL